MGIVIMYSLLGLFGAALVFLLSFAILSKITENLTCDSDKVVIVVVTIAIMMGVTAGVLIGIAGYNWDKHVEVTGLELLDNTSYMEDQNEVDDISDTSTKQHPNRFTVRFNNGSSVEVPRSNVKMIKFADGSTTEIKQRNK